MSDLHPIPRSGAGEPNVDVIFVHGLSGDPFATWQHDRRYPEDSWPFWLAEEVPEAAVWTLGYEAAWHQWFGRDAMPLPYRARDVLAELVSHRLGRVPICFICHSLGGLLVKKVLESAATLNNPDWEPITKQTRAIAFIGSPQAGADLATLLFRFGRVLGSSPAIEDLRAHDANLIHLNIWYRQNAARLGVRTLCYYETRDTKVKLLGILPSGVRVVAPADADPGIVGVIPSPLDGDHFAICKPTRRNTRLAVEITDLVRNILATSSDQSGKETIDRPKPIISNPLALPVDLPDFLGREDQIERLTEILTSSAALGLPGIAAVSGVGGVGKSALALRVAHQLADAAPDGRIYIDMGGTSAQPLTPIAAMSRVIQVLRPEAELSIGLEQNLYRDCLAGKRVLLLLDNAENSEQVQPLVEWCALTTLLIVTSRQPITAPGLINLSLEVMNPGEACDLLRALLGARLAGDEEIAALSQLCGRLPLALRVAGTFLAASPDLTIHKYIREFIAQKQHFEWLAIKDNARLHVFSALGVSASELAVENPQLAQRWQMLVHFPTSFDTLAVAEMWGCSDRTAAHYLALLEQRALIQRDHSLNRFRLVQLARELANRPIATPAAAAEGVRISPNETQQAKKVFLSYAREDFMKVSQIYDRLSKEGFKPWMDKKDILPGKAWQEEIKKAIKSSDFALLFLSQVSVRKRGYVQREFEMALDILKEHPHGTIFTIPVCLDGCEPPDRFSELQWADLSDEEGFEKILLAMRAEN